MSDKRQTILDVALALFCAHGYHAVGIDRVIAESCVAKMTMYKYFPSKNALIAAVLYERDQRFRQSLIDFVDGFTDPAAKLQAVFLWHHRWFNEPSFNGCMFINAVAEFPEPDNAIRQASITHKALIQAFIESLLIPMSLETSISRRLAMQCLQLLDGATVATQVTGDTEAAHLAWRSAVALLSQEWVQIDPGGSFTPARG